MINLNEQLEEIIFKYQLDRYFPKYRKMLQATKILGRLIKESIVSETRIAFVASEEIILKIIRQYSMDNDFIMRIQYDEEQIERLEEVHWDNFDRVILMPFHNVRCLERWFLNRKINYVWIYDIFEDYQLYFEGEFYILNTVHVHDSIQKLLFPGAGGQKVAQSNFQLEMYVQQIRYKYLKEPWKRRTLEKMFFLAVYIKNFVLAEHYYKIIIDRYGCDEHFIAAWQEISDLFLQIKEGLKRRTQKDIVMYWMDELPYYEVEDMPYLKSVVGKGIYFKNMYTCMPHTRPTFYSLFFQHKSLSEWLENTTDNGTGSIVISYLQKKGYKFKVLSEVMYWLHESYCASTRRELYTPTSEKMWDLIQTILSSEKPVFVLVHALAETHTPCLNSNMSGGNILDYYYRFQEGKKELDNQLKFYDSLMPSSSLRIFMSDHGKAFNCKFRVHFNIIGQALSHKSIDSLCSLVDFFTIIKQLLECEDIDESEFARDYVEVQELPRYNKSDIMSIINDKSEFCPSELGYKGVITKEYEYFRFFTGDELLRKRRKNKLSDIDIFEAPSFADLEICDDKELYYFRSIVGECSKEILSNKKLKYSRLLFEIYQNKKERKEKIKTLINQQFDDYEGEIGLRFGGLHSYELFCVLSSENKKKITCIFDKNQECICACLNIPILSPESICKGLVKAVVLSSFCNLEMLKEEAKAYLNEIQIINIYEYMEQHGYFCERNFFEEKSDDDYNVYINV